MTEEELDSLQAKCDAATDWPPGELSRTLAGVYQEPKIWHLATADFYSAAREQLPRLIAELRAERKRSFTLAANQCHNGYAAEGGHHGCKEVDRLQLELEEWEGRNDDSE